MTTNRSRGLRQIKPRSAELDPDNQQGVSHEASPTGVVASPRVLDASSSGSDATKQAKEGPKPARMPRKGYEKATFSAHITPKPTL